MSYYWEEWKAYTPEYDKAKRKWEADEILRKRLNKWIWAGFLASVAFFVWTVIQCMGA